MVLLCAFAMFELASQSKLLFEWVGVASPSFENQCWCRLRMCNSCPRKVLTTMVVSFAYCCLVNLWLCYNLVSHHSYFTSMSLRSAIKGFTDGLAIDTVVSFVPRFENSCTFQKWFFSIRFLKQSRKALLDRRFIPRLYNTSKTTKQKLSSFLRYDKKWKSIWTWKKAFLTRP